MAEQALPSVEMYTDGACRGNPGPGGWGVLLLCRGQEKTLSGFEQDTTNNRMELLAPIRGLSALKGPCQVDLYTDSKYVQQGMTQWLKTWRANGWKTAGKKPVKNQDLWQQLEALSLVHTLNWHWVKGHSNNPGNERADQLAVSAIDRGLREDRA